jgi:hypothetical protein
MIKEFKNLKEACEYLKSTQFNKVLFDKYLKVFYKNKEVGIILYYLRGGNSQIYDFHPIILDNFDIYGYSHWQGVQTHIQQLGLDLENCTFKLFPKD